MPLIEDIRARTGHPRSQSQVIHRLKTWLEQPSTRLRGFVLFNVLYGGVWAGHFVDLFRFSLGNKHYTHFVLIPLISLFLLYVRRQTLLAQAAYAVPAGTGLGLVGVLVYFLGLSQQQHLSQNDMLALTTLGIGLVWVGGFVAFFGLRSTRSALFPLGFLGFAIPLPEVVLNGLITALQQASADVAHVLFKLTPIPVYREGIYFAFPGLSIEVAKECSSIRSSMALLIACVLANHLLLQRWWSKGIMLLLVYPLAVVKNGIRIVTLSLLTLYVDKGFIKGDLHTKGGFVFFALAATILAAVLAGLRRLESRRATKVQQG